jgi:hypothetical protein
MKHKFMVALSLIFGLLALQPSLYGQTARVALETYEEGPVPRYTVRQRVWLWKPMRKARSGRS